MEKLLDCDYIESYEKWEIQKNKLLKRYKNIYLGKYFDIRIIRVKTDTKGLRCYCVYGKEMEVK